MPNLTLLRARNLLKKGYKGFPSRINIVRPSLANSKLAPCYGAQLPALSTEEAVLVHTSYAHVWTHTQLTPGRR
jgi:hypothetical protein